MVHVKLANGMSFVNYHDPVGWWYEDQNSWSPEEVDAKGEHITHYKLA